MNIREMKPVTIESPYAGDVEANLAYLDECIRDCLSRDESPYASHKMLTTALDDNITEERDAGISAGLAMSKTLSSRIFYVDRGWSGGMKAARKYYDENGISYEIRKIYGSDE